VTSSIDPTERSAWREIFLQLRGSKVERVYGGSSETGSDGEPDRPACGKVS